MSLPPTDEQGRFLPQLETGSMFKRVFAKFLDALLTGAFSASLLLVLPMPWAALIGTSWFMLSDWFGSPAKWLFRLKVVHLDGSAIGPFASLQRNFMLGLPTIARAVIVSGWWGADVDAAKWDRGAVACIGLSVMLGELIGMVMQPQNRRWGDHFARTRVVER